MIQWPIHPRASKRFTRLRKAQLQPAIISSRIISNALMLTLIALAASMLLNAHESVRAQKPIAVESEALDYTVHLGDKIMVTVSIVIEDDIQEARFWLQPHGKNTIPSYHYSDFEQTDRVDATTEFGVRTPSYFPPGTRFDGRFEFVASDGTVYSTDTYVIDYLDRQRDWQRVADDRLEIVYYGLNRRSIEGLHSASVARLPEIIESLRLDDAPQLRAVVFPNLRDLTTYGPMFSQAATDGMYFGGYAYDEYRLLLMSSPSLEVMVHELTHLLFGLKLDSPYAYHAPAWLNEGHSSFWETGSRAKSIRQFRSIVRSDRVTEFSKMNAVPGIRNEISNFYTQSNDFVGYLIEEYGRDSIGKMLEQLNEGKNIDEAMRVVFGGSLVEVENRWRAEWDLPPLSEAPVLVNVEEALPPTIPGLPTIETGTLEMLDSEPDETVAVAVETPTAATPQPAQEAPVLVNVEEALPPTIPGLPAVETGTLEMLDSEPDETVAVAAEAPTVAAPQPTPKPHPTTVSGYPSAPYPPTPVPLPTPDRGLYFVGGPDGEGPTIRPSAVIIFFVLLLGFGALLFRRMRV